MDKFDIRSVVFVFLVLLSLVFLYTAYDKETKTLQMEKIVKVFSFEDLDHSFKEINKILALASIGLIALVFIVGPLSKFWPEKFAHYLAYRKPVGLWGFALALIHTIYSFIRFYNLDVINMITGPYFLAALSGTIALVIFAIMSIESTKKAVIKMGYRKWKAVQTTGYVALGFAVMHFFFVESKPGIGFDVRPYGIVFFVLAIFAILLRYSLAAVNVPERKSYEEHFGKKAKETQEKEKKTKKRKKKSR